MGGAETPAVYGARETVANVDPVRGSLLSGRLVAVLESSPSTLENYSYQTQPAPRIFEDIFE